MTPTSGAIFDPDTCLTRWGHTGWALEVGEVTGAALERLRDLLAPASVAEVTDQLTLLAMHRRKGGLAEAGVPVFLEQVARDLVRVVGISSLGAALLMDHLRTHPADVWFPHWVEIEPVALAIEAGLQGLREPQSALPETLPEPWTPARPVVPAQPTEAERLACNARWDEIEANLLALGMTGGQIPRWTSALDWTRERLAERAAAQQVAEVSVA